jgi:acyl carrier protein
MPTPNEIRARVAKVLVDALGVEEDEIKPSATLEGDLGAESIDFLDIVFRLEREFGLRVRQGELFAGPVFQGTAEVVQDGRLTDEGLAALRTQMPFANLRDLERDRRLNRIDDLFTVDLLSRFISWKLGGRLESAEDAPAPNSHHSPEVLTMPVASTRI